MHMERGRKVVGLVCSEDANGENKTIYEKEGIAKIGEVMLQISALGDWRRVEG